MRGNHQREVAHSALLQVGDSSFLHSLHVDNVLCLEDDHLEELQTNEWEQQEQRRERSQRDRTGQVPRTMAMANLQETEEKELIAPA